MSTQFDRPLVGFRFVQTLIGDSLQSIALRELGDSSRWTELISYNKLVPPFIVDDPARAAAGVLLSGAMILVPAQTRAAIDTDPDAVYGTDAVLTSRGELLLTDGGDFEVVSGRANLVQALSHRLDTERGDLGFHPAYGNDVRRLIGKVNGPTRGLIGAQVTRASVAQDPRVVRALRSKAEVRGDSINISVEVQTVTGHAVSVAAKV